MRQLASIIVVALALCIGARAQLPPSGDLTFPASQAYAVDYGQFSGIGATNPIFTNQVYQNYGHTIQLFNTSGSNALVAVDTSIAGTNWSVLFTNTVAATTGNFLTNYQIKTGYFRYRLFATNNAGLAVDYEGGR